MRTTIEAIRKRVLEPKDIPHVETLYIMEQLDNLRKEWGVTYPEY